MGLYADDGRCHNANSGTYGHECGKPARWIGTAATGFRSGFCDHCKAEGDEARRMVTWAPIRFTYRPLLRPASFATLPAGVAWEYVEAPPNLITRPDLPRSRWPFGVISLDRALTERERLHFDLIPHD